MWTFDSDSVNYCDQDIESFLKDSPGLLAQSISQ